MGSRALLFQAAESRDNRSDALVLTASQKRVGAFTTALVHDHAAPLWLWSHQY